MSERNEIYECVVCKNILQVLSSGIESPSCCDQLMKKLEEKTADFILEKHVPLLERVEDGFLVTVGSTLHPMEENHYIQWIELIIENLSYRKYLKSHEEPKAFFCVKDEDLLCSDKIIVREYCNLHKLWRN